MKNKETSELKLKNKKVENKEEFRFKKASEIKKTVLLIPFNKKTTNIINVLKEYLPENSFIMNYVDLHRILPNNRQAFEVEYCCFDSITKNVVLLDTSKIQIYNGAAKLYLYNYGPLFIKLKISLTKDLQKPYYPVKIFPILKQDSIFNLYGMKVFSVFSKLYCPNEGLHIYKDIDVQPLDIKHLSIQELEENLKAYDIVTKDIEPIINHDFKLQVLLKNIDRNNLKVFDKSKHSIFINTSIAYIIDYWEFRKMNIHNVILYFSDSRKHSSAVLVYPMLGFYISEEDYKLIDKFVYLETERKLRI